MYKMQRAKGSNSQGGQRTSGPKSYYGRESAPSNERAGASVQRRSSSTRPGEQNRNRAKSFGGPSSRPSSFRGQNQGGTRQRFSRQRSEKIDISKFIQRSVPEGKASDYKPNNKFSSFGFCPELQRNLDRKGYIQPTPIQDQSIAHIMAGKDLTGLANTGTGKTAAFLLPLIDRIYKNRYEKVIIIAPTRELAVQIDNEFRGFAQGMNLFSAICVGGTPIGKQIYNLKRNPSFVIGTPGRLKDLCNRKLINLPTFQNIVLDEVDRMLDMGFVDEITLVLNQLPAKKQSLFFSATMPQKIRNLVKEFQNNPVIIEVKSGDTAKNVLQDIVRVRGKEEKFSELQKLLLDPEMKKVLIFSETKYEVEKLTVNLCNTGHRAESIHGDKRQSQRQKALAAFKNEHVRILVATDVASRGLDIDDISHVINYTVPQTYDDYVHRIGRTGRGDKKGMALTFVE